MSLVNIQPGWKLFVAGAHTTVKSGSKLSFYRFVIPEPGTLVPWAAAIVLLIPRRR